MVDDAKKVNDEFSIAGQVTPEQLQQASDAGFKSVLNLRSPNEAGVLADEQQKAEAAGLAYTNVPLSSTEAAPQSTITALQALNDLPKPVLLHCGAGMRAGAIALIAAAIQEGLTLEQVIERAKELGLNPEQPHLKQFILENYLHENSSD